MAKVQDISQSQISLSVEGSEPDRFLVIRYRGSERLCALYQFEIEIASTDGDVPFADVIGKPAVLTAQTKHGQRWFHGIISRFEMTGQVDERTYYRAELVPSVWLLTQRYQSRIYQSKSVQEIITDVLDKAGIPSDQVRFALDGTYEPREFCVQYRETDYHFISRLMEEEGIWWYFEQAQESYALVIADSAAAYRAIDEEPRLPFVPHSGQLPNEEHVHSFRIGEVVRPGAVTLNDFNFKQPPLKLQSTHTGELRPELEFHDCPGDYATAARGAALAKLRAEELAATHIAATGESDCYRLTCGRTFELTEHPNDAANDQFLVTGLTHEGRQSITWTNAGTNDGNGLANGFRPVRRIDRLYREGQVAWDPTSDLSLNGSRFGGLNGYNGNGNGSANGTGASQQHHASYECTFECIPASVTYRPARVTPRPVVRGSQSARVVGPASEEIHTDEFGRVKLQFNWDREGKFDDTSSCWVRVSQGMAGGQYGMMFLPRVGQEVIVDFLEGDPDKPVVVGRLFNGDHKPPYELPANKTRSVIKTHTTKGGGGANEICFEDLKGKEQLQILAQRDLQLGSKNNLVETAGGDLHRKAKNSFELIDEVSHREVKLDCNDKIGGKMSLAVSGDLGAEIGGNHSEQANNFYLKGGSNVVLEAGSALTLKVGGNHITIDAAGITILGTMVKINSSGSPAGSGMAVALSAPEAPIEAGTSQPGRDKRYEGGGQLAAAEAPPPLPGTKTSWIEIELVDEIGQPVRGEKYEVIGADDEIIASGSLNKEGWARAEVPEKATYQIKFPNLDAAAWERQA